MVKDIISAKKLCEIDSQEEQCLSSNARPILLLRKRFPIPVADAVAPDNPFLGILLPYTPLHHLLFKAVGDIPLVMTSANRKEEPIIHSDEAPRNELRALADLTLTHTRPIEIRCDDSVVSFVDGTPSLLRRSRGYAPLPISLPFACKKPTLALGGQQKNTVCLGRQSSATLSQHLGDLEGLESFKAYTSSISHLGSSGFPMGKV